jgi:hypothetical protein
MVSHRLTMMSFLAATALSGFVSPAFAQSASPDDRMRSIEQQIQSLQQELRNVRHDLQTRDGQVRAAQRDAAAARQAASTPAPALTAPAVVAVQPPLPPVYGAPPNATIVPVTTSGFGKVQIGGVTVTLGGFIEADSIFRSATEGADVASSWNAIPFNQSPSSHLSEFRASGRASRLSLLMQGAFSPSTSITGYFEGDLLAAAPTANSQESNSYTPRVRQAFVQIDDKDWGLHVLAGQAWSLVTTTKSGLTARQEATPLVVDAQMVPGFSWTRQPQLRVAEDFDNGRYWLGASLESPQATFFTGPNGTGLPTVDTVTTTIPGGSGFASTNNYSVDVAPDMIVKAATDTSFGHFEAFGLLRLLRDRVSVVGTGNNKVTPAGGGGVGMYVPLVPGRLELQGNVMAGAGIGRYGSAQLPDAIVGADGAPKPIPEVEAMIGLVGHPLPTVDIYGYAGTEQESRTSFSLAGKGFGYGSPLYSNAGCDTELSSASCVGNTSGVTQGAVGYWWRFMHGSFGTVQTGAEYSYTVRNTFKGIGGAPSATENIVMLSLRYTPFQ